MTARVLPAAEWDRLVGLDVHALTRICTPERLSVVVVEDDAGTIVGCWGALTFLHTEGIWIAPEHRGRPGVGRRLLGAMRRVVAERGERMVWTGATTPEVDALIRHAGGVLMEGRHYALPMQEHRS